MDSDPELDPDLDLELDLANGLGGLGLDSLDFGSDSASASTPSFNSSPLIDFPSSSDDEGPADNDEAATPLARSRHSSATKDADPGALRRSRGPSSSASSNRLSLAFELASAASPNKRASNRELLRSLGIDEGDSEDDDEGDEPPVDSSSSDGDCLDDSGYGDAARNGHGSAGAADGRGRQSSSASAPDADDPHASAMARQEIDAQFLSATSALSTALSTTGDFLAHLRQHTAVADSDPPAVPLPDDYTDRQPLLESLTSSVIKRMYDLTRQREAQVRELGDLERLLAAPSPSFQLALSSLEPLPSPPPSPAAHAPPPFPTAARVELSNLRDITASLITALAAITEVTQVNSAGVGDAGRKLRALRGHLGAARDDLVGLERSERFVEEYERREGGKEKGRFAQLAREQMRGAQVALEEGWIRAQEVLAVAA